MAKVRGTGFAAVNYPTGMHLGGDPTQSLIHMTPAGDFVVTMASVDLGQGLRTVLAQIAAETLGVPYESIVVETADTDTGPHCTGTFASRTTHRAGNAVVMAAQEARKAMLEVAGELLEASPEDLETDGDGNIHIKGVAEKSVSVGEVAGAAHFGYGKSIAGRGAYLKPPSPMDPETGECDPDSTQAHACTIVEVEVDTETGMVEVLDMKSVYEVGQQVNPDLVKGQIVGGSWMGIGHALYETTAPGYPAIDPAPVDFQNYLQPGASEMPDVTCEVLEYPAESGPLRRQGRGRDGDQRPDSGHRERHQQRARRAHHPNSGDARGGPPRPRPRRGRRLAPERGRATRRVAKRSRECSSDRNRPPLSFVTPAAPDGRRRPQCRTSFDHGEMDMREDAVAARGAVSQDDAGDMIDRDRPHPPTSRG